MNAPLQIGDALQVNDATISLIEPVVIPDVFSECSNLKPDFSFLGSVEDYSRYYTDLESSQGRTRDPAMIPELGSLFPLGKKHALHSYWRYYRLSIENAEKEGKSLRDLFLFLPLEINLSIKPITVNNQSFMAKVHVYLFPFGSCTINMDVKVPSVSLADFISLVPRVKGANITRTDLGGNAGNAGTFKRLAHSIANQISVALFGSQRTVLEFSPHTFLFVRKTSPDGLNDTAEPHKRAIAAAMAGQSLDNIPLQDNLESYFRAKLKTIQPGEILLFSPIGSFVYMSPLWKSTEKKLQRKANCMRNNYQSCLNLLFAVNRFLATCTPAKQPGVPQERLDSLKNALSLVFSAKPFKKMYFEHVYTGIAPVIGLDNSLKELGQAWGWT